MVLLKLTSPNRTNSHRFTESYDHLSLPGDNETNYECALVSASVWYSWYNISTAFNNHKFNYKNTLGVSKHVFLPDGLYTITQIISLIETGITSNGDAVSNIAIVPNYNTGRIEITLDNGYEIDFTYAELYGILGYDADTELAGDVKHISPHVADITRNVNDISINCSLVSSSYSNGYSSNVLYAFTPNKEPGMLLDVVPNQRVYSEINIKGGENINRISMFLTDNLGRDVDLNGEPVSYLLDIRPTHS